MSRQPLTRLRSDLRQSVNFQGQPGNMRWLRAAIALAALGYTAVVAHRLLYLPVQPWAHTMEIVAAVVAMLAFLVFPVSPSGASAAVLAVIWVEPILSIGTSGTLSASIVLLLPVVVALGGMIFGHRVAIVLAATTMAAIPLALAQHSLRAGTGGLIPAGDVSTVIVAEFVLTGTGLLTWAMVRSLAQARAVAELARTQYEALFDHSPTGLLALDETTRIVEINAAAAGMLGLAPGSIHGRPLGEVLADAGATTPLDLKTASPQVPVELVLAPSGAAPRCLEFARQFEAGADSRQIVALTDVTERRRADLRLRESEERFRSLIESVPNLAVQGYDRDRRVFFWNSASVALYGYAEAEALGRKLEDLIIPADMREGVIAAVEAWVGEGRRIPAGELTLRRKDGQPVHVFSSHVMQLNSRAEPEMYCLDVDLSDRDRATAGLRESEARFRMLFNSSNDAVMVYPILPDGSPDRFIEANEVACSRLEYARDELLRLTPLDLEPPAAAAAARERLARLRSGGRLLAETEHVAKSGRRFAVEVSAQLFELDARPTVVAVARDISARQALEQQLRHAQKMEVVGRLAGGVAHDFNNILTAMLLSLEVMQTKAPDPETRGHLRDLDDMAKRAAKLTQQLLMFARRQTLQTSRLELNAALAALLKMLRRLIGENIKVTTEAGAPELWLEADAGLLDQVIMNLCLNARDAMPDGGLLTLTTAAAKFDAVAPPGHPEARPGEFACLHVTDNGCGMSPDVVQHLFEPFFTTKDVGQGTGLGLAAIHGIVHQHQGWIEVTSTVGQGSTFSVFLPCAGALKPAAPAPSPRAPREKGHETILLVEDEDIVRKVTQAMLGMLGYRVLTAANSDEALRVWSDKAATIDLLFTDMVLPGGLSGLRLGEKLRQAKPDLKVVLMTGYSSEFARGEAQRRNGFAFLPKPFESRTLSATIRRALDQDGT